MAKLVGTEESLWGGSGLLGLWIWPGASLEVVLAVPGTDRGRATTGRLGAPSAAVGWMPSMI